MAQQSDVVAIGFPSRVSDDVVAELLQAHSATPSRIYISTSGFTGSHSSHNAISRGITGTAFVKEARRETVAFFEKAIEGNDFRLQKVFEAHSQEELVQDKKLNSDLRTYLRLRAQFENVLRDSKEGAPIVYAVDVSVAPGNIDKLRANPLVRVAIAKDEALAQRQVAQTIKPASVEEEYFADETSGLSESEVVSKAAALVDASRPVVRVGRPGLAR